jgi:hypothetical protein
MHGFLAEASERRKQMSIPNIGPEHTEEPDATDCHRKGNPALVYRDEPSTDEMRYASARATTVSHRFGGVRHALTRRATKPEDDAGAS